VATPTVTNGAWLARARVLAEPPVIEPPVLAPGHYLPLLGVDAAPTGGLDAPA
jgi:hypothetical protein